MPKEPSWNDLLQDYLTGQHERDQIRERQESASQTLYLAAPDITVGNPDLGHMASKQDRLCAHLSKYW